MPARLVSVPFGPAATRVLADLVTDLRGGDPLAPVTVTVPSAAAGTTLRRSLAGAGGLVGVAVESLPQLAARLAAPALVAADRAPLPEIVRRGHLRAALRAAPGRLAAAADSAATERAMERSYAELADLEDHRLDALAGRGGTTAQVVDIVRAVRAATTPDAADAAMIVRAATGAVRAGEAPLAAIGPVVVHLPRRLRPAELELLAALAAAHPVAVTVGRTGDPDADAPAAELLAALGRALGVDAEVVAGPDAPPLPTELVRAPDPAEEAVVAARLVVAALADGVRPERVAVLHRVRDPYAALLHEQLGAAGVAHHVRSVRTLAQSVAGRVLLGALALPDTRFRRADVVAWWRSGPVLDLATGRRVPVSWWDRLGREAGVVGGLEQWRQRLEQAADARRAHLARRPPPEGELPDLEDRRLAGYAALSDAVAAVAARLTPPADASWAAWSRWAGALLDAVLGREPGAGEWPEEERDARTAVAATIESLARLDGVDATPDLHRVRRVLERELEQPARPHGRFGHGVAVGSLVDAVGAELDLVVVVGAAEGQFPPRRGDDPLVPDRERRAAGGDVPRRGRSREEEARDLLAALAAAPRRVLVAPRSDPRAQRERQPAPAYLDACGTLAGRLVASGQIDALRAGAPWFTDVESFEWWPGGGRPEQLPGDLDVADLLADHRAGRPVLDGVAAAASPSLRRGLEAAVARRSGAFDAWSGDIGARPDLLDGFDQPRSPTGLEQYARCPFRYFLGHVLGVRPLDDPTDAEVMSGRDLGSLVHAVLERLVAERGIGKPPDEPWTDDDRRRLLAIADELAGQAEAEGRTGRPLLWGVRWEQLRRHLLGILDLDEQERAAGGLSPVAVELGFGIDDDPPVVLDVREGRAVAFRGMIDRVDRSADGRRLLVVDYKTGSDFGYEVDVDMTARGQKLQLGVYALAARRAFPEAEEVEARYWFLDRPGARSRRGGVFDEAAEARFRGVVDTVLDGVVGGRFPANPGDETWDRGRYVHDHCTHCDFDRVCPTTRGWRWQQARQDPALAAYVALAEADDEPEAEDE